jgi:hypothetical protein
MPDAPDFYQYRLESDKRLLNDMAELAVRLGSVVKYDRSGSMIFGDSFDNGLAPYLPQLGGTGAAADIVSATTYTSGYSVRLTAGSDGNHSAGVLKRLEPQVINMLGFEATFSLETNTYSLILIIQHNTATEKKRWMIAWKPADGALRYYDADGNYQTFATLTLPTGDEELFHTVKLVIDLETEYYSRVMVDQNRYDLSDYVGRVEIEATDPRLEFEVNNMGRSGENDIMYVDEFIVTTDEIA